MSVMVERVARAICANRPGAYNKYDTFSQNDLELARAAIAAMREPTEDMANMAECAEPFSFEAMWKAAIDEALK